MLFCSIKMFFFNFISFHFTMYCFWFRSQFLFFSAELDFWRDLVFCFDKPWADAKKSLSVSVIFKLKGDISPLLIFFLIAVALTLDDLHRLNSTSIKSTIRKFQGHLSSQTLDWSGIPADLEIKTKTKMNVFFS